MTKKQVSTRRRRGEGDTVALTVRVPREGWKRLHMVAISEGVSLQELTIRAYSRLLQDLDYGPLSKPPVDR